MAGKLPAYVEEPLDEMGQGYQRYLENQLSKTGKKFLLAQPNITATPEEAAETEADLMRSSLDEVMSTLKTSGATDAFTSDEVVELTKRVYEKRTQTKRYHTEMKPAGWTEAVASGAAIQPEQVIDTESAYKRMTGQPYSHSDERVRADFTRRLAEQGAPPDVIRALQDEDYAKVEDYLLQTNPQMLTRFQQELTGTRAYEDRGTLDKWSGILTATGPIQSAIGGAAVRGAEYIKGEKDPTRDMTLAEKFEYGLGAIPRAAMGAVEGFGAFFSDDPGARRFDINQIGTNVYGKVYAEALEIAKRELPTGTPQSWDQRAQEIVENRLAHTPGGVFAEYPNASRMAVEMVADPLAGPAYALAGGAVRGGAKAAALASKATGLTDNVLKPAAKAVSEMPGVQKATDMADKLFAYEPGLRKVKDPKLQSELRMAKDAKQFTGTEFTEQLGGDIEKIKALGLNDAEKGVIADILEGREVAAEALNKIRSAKVQKGLDIAQHWPKQARTFMEENGLWQKMDDADVLVELKPRANYMPHKIEDLAAAKVADVSDDAYVAERTSRLASELPDSVVSKDLEAGAQKARNINTSKVYEKDPMTQFAANAEELIQKAQDVTHLSEIKAALVRNKAVRVVGRHVSNAKLAEMMRTIETTTGQKQAVLTPEMTHLVLRATGKVGDKVRYGKRMVVPEGVEQIIERATKYLDLPVTDAKKKPLEVVADAYGHYMRNYIRPVTGIIKRMRILPRLGHLTEDAASSIQYVYTAGKPSMGTLKLGDELGTALATQRAALAVAMSTIQDGSKLSGDLAEATYTFANGSAVPMEKLVKAMHKYGVIDNFAHRMGIETVLGASKASTKQGRKIADAMKQLEHLSSKPLTPLMKGAKAIDAYHHAAVFLGALESMEPQHVAKALDLMHDYAPAYHRLGAAEKLLARDGFGFYTFQRFAIKNMMKGIATNPVRMMRIERLREAAARAAESNIPVNSEFTSERGKHGFAAPRQFQSKEWTKYLDNPDDIPEMGSTEYIQIIPQTPMLLALAFLKQYMPIVFGGANEKDYATNLNFIPKLIYELLKAEDLETGAKLEGMNRVTQPFENLAMSAVPAGFDWREGREGGYVAGAKILLNGWDGLADKAEAHGFPDLGLNLRMYARAHNALNGAFTIHVENPYKEAQKAQEKGAQRSPDTIKLMSKDIIE
jgi:hypothetical protein